jgi:PAS domain S-box-containing protein
MSGEISELDREREVIHLERARRRQATLFEVAIHQSVIDGDLDGAVTLITERVAEIIEVERVSVWMLNQERSKLSCADLFERAPARHSAGVDLIPADYPRYFQALASGRAIDAHDACRDPRTSELLESYLEPLAISSMLDSPVRIFGEVVGVVCLEHTGPQRTWDLDEITFSAAVADQVAQTLLNRRHKRSESELRRAQSVVHSIINSMPSVLIGVDDQHRVTQWNLEAERATSVSEAEALGKPLDLVYPLLETELPKVDEAIRSHEVVTTPRMAPTTHGELRYQTITVFPLVSEGVEGAVIQIDDITERIRLEEMMIQSEKMLSVGGLAAGMAHEINNPLAGIMQNAAVISNRLTGDIPANERAAAVVGTSMEVIRAYVEKRQISRLLELMNQAGSQAAEIVQNMLSFARKSESQFALQSLTELLDSTLNLAKSDYDLKKKYDFRRIEIFREYDSSLPEVECEGSKIQQVILNILRNGAEAMADLEEGSQPPRFILRAFPDGDMARVEIEDTGRGMDESICSRVFEPFFTTKPVDLGTGLGLSVSHHIITKNHGGTLTVRSEPGKGSCFIIRIPVRKQE